MKIYKNSINQSINVYLKIANKIDCTKCVLACSAVNKEF